MFYLVIVVIGMCLASFVNVVVYRLPRNEDFIFGRSYCPNCHHELYFLDMIPLISYIFIRGKCRYCNAHISIRDTIIELFGGIVTLLCYLVYGNSMMFIITLAITFLFITISLLDYDTMFVNDQFQLILLMIVIISMFFYKVSLLDRILGTIFLTIPLYLINCFKECIGGADLKLIAIMGWMLGFYDAFIGFSIGVIIASLYSIIMLSLHKVTLKTFIPLIPFLCIGFYISLINIQIFSTYFI